MAASQRNIVTALVSVPSVEAKLWIELLKPAGSHLVEPLEARFRDNSANRDAERPMMAAAIAAYSDCLENASLQLRELVLLADNEREFVPLMEALRPHRKTVSSNLRELLSHSPPGGGEPGILGNPKSKIRDAFWKKQANAAVCLLQLGEQDAVWPLLKLTPNPSLRSFIIDRLPKLGADFGTLASHLARENDASIRQAVVMAFGDFDIGKLSHQQQHHLVEQLLMLYHTDPDPGVHSAVAWTMRQSQYENAIQRLDIKQQKALSQTECNWFVNSQGETFVLVSGPVEPQIGQDSKTTKVPLIRRFAIAAHEVTVEQFQQFRPEQARDIFYSPSVDCPMNKVSWYDAVAYCNWLSQQEGIKPNQWCYEPIREGKNKGTYAEGTTIPADYLQRNGYRLPTLAEWEYACRGTATSAYSLVRPSNY